MLWKCLLRTNQILICHLTIITSFWAWCKPRVIASLQLRPFCNAVKGNFIKYKVVTITLPSMSSTLYMHIFRTKFWCQKVTKLNILEKATKKVLKRLTHEKGVCKTLMKLTPAVNFINILRTNEFFVRRSLRQLLYVHVTRKKLPKWNARTKNLRV
jgi:hypothetical protein